MGELKIISLEVDTSEVSSQECIEAAVKLLRAAGLPAGPTVTFEVYCDTCGHGLCNESRFVVTEDRHVPSIRVEACPKCLERVRLEAQ